ncbi:RNA polymerase ECF-subfamily sigma factor [Streptomyces sp. AA4]|nr:RNA polymerase ECF-subfamily sigma factor [Streptomyces sp. AA4]
MRGRGPGGAGRRGRAVVGRRGAGQPARLAADGRHAPVDRPLAQRERSATARGNRCGAGRRADRGRGRAGGRAAAGAGRHAHVVVPVLPSGGDAQLASRADAARGWRVDDCRDRTRVPGAGGHHGATDHAAKESVAAAGSTFTPPSAEDWPARLQVVLHVLYLIFNEGYTATSGEDLHRVELSEEAIRLTRAVHSLLPDDGEVAGLLALMLLTDARRPARTGPDGALTPLADQDRRLWTVPLIVEGLELVNRVLGRGPVGPYQVQAAIAALHDQAAGTDSTDWAQILELYGLLEHLAPGPVTTLNRAIAVAMVHGPEKALALLATLEDDARLKQGHRFDAVRAHLLELAGDTAGAHEHYLRAAKRTSSMPERRYLQAKAAKFLPRGR